MRRTHPSIRLVAKDKNIGVIPTLSRGLSEARGQYVYFGAADDFVLPGFFAAAINMLQAHPTAGLFSGDAVLVDGHSGRSLGARPPVRPRLRSGFIDASEVAGLLRRNDNFVVTGAAVFRRDAVVSAGGFDEATFVFCRRLSCPEDRADDAAFVMRQRTVLTWCVFPDSVSRTTSTQPDRAQQFLKRSNAARGRSGFSFLVSERLPPPLAFCYVAPCRSGRPHQSRHADGNGRAECDRIARC